MPHLLSIADLDRATVERLMSRAEQLLHDVVKKNGQLPLLHGQVVAHLFFEPSTRTQYSFSIAAHRLGAFVLNPVISHSSTVKGESLLDTVRTFVAMGARLIVVRHKEEHILEQLVKEIKEPVCIVNGGDGRHQHPTQALLDLLTIQQHQRDFSRLRVAIIGDIAHSRVARSLVQALKMMQCSQIAIIAPPEFLPPDIKNWPVTCYDSMADGLVDADVVVALRIQWERMEKATTPTSVFEKFQLTTENLRRAKPNAIVMHPAPINRGMEITSDVADGPQSVIFKQMTNGVALRMAVIEWLLVR